MQLGFALDIFVLACWGIWIMRNDIIFGNMNASVQQFKRHVFEEASALRLRIMAASPPN
jgi:hypothetical protein